MVNHGRGFSLNLRQRVGRKERTLFTGEPDPFPFPSRCLVTNGRETRARGRRTVQKEDADWLGLERNNKKRAKATRRASMKMANLRIRLICYKSSRLAGGFLSKYGKFWGVVSVEERCRGGVCKN